MQKKIYFLEREGPGTRFCLYPPVFFVLFLFFLKNIPRFPCPLQAFCFLDPPMDRHNDRPETVHDAIPTLIPSDPTALVLLLTTHALRSSITYSHPSFSSYYVNHHRCPPLRRGGGGRCRMSIIRNANVACLCRSFFHVKLRKIHAYLKCRISVIPI